MKTITGGVTAATGFEAAGIEAGVKYLNRKDLALVYSKIPCVSAGVFTSNVVKAAPVTWDRELVRGGTKPIHAVVINTGIANACTGREGYEICRQTADKTAEVLGVEADSVLVASTGVIGMQIPLDKIVNNLDKLAAAKSHSPEAGTNAAKAIMTTDTLHKETAVTFTIGGKTVTLGGMAKGSGMIHPNMCTMLCFLTTDLAIEKTILQKALSEVVVDTFNMISVDGDTSTNDSLVVLANGLAENPVLDKEGEDYETLKAALTRVCTTLAKKMAGDGEGATALFETQDIHADTKDNARKLAKSVICSSLTKAMIYGHDANVGRIMCALGYSGVSFDPEQVELFCSDGDKEICIARNGMLTDYDEAEATRILSAPEVKVTVDMKMGEEAATAWGCDLTYEYVKINADYRS